MANPLRPFTTLRVDTWVECGNPDNRGKLTRQHAEAHASNATHCADCDWLRWIGYLHKCLYCGLWFCPACAEFHFGQTLSDWVGDKRAEKRAEIEQRRLKPLEENASPVKQNEP